MTWLSIKYLKRLIIKDLDNQSQFSVILCLIVEDFDNPDQELNNQINYQSEVGKIFDKCP
jgi:hypothetical protein